MLVQQKCDLNSDQHSHQILVRSSICGVTSSVDNRHIPMPPRGINEDRERVQFELISIPEQTCLNLIDSMFRRIRAVISARGDTPNTEICPLVFVCFKSNNFEFLRSSCFYEPRRKTVTVLNKIETFVKNRK